MQFGISNETAKRLMKFRDARGWAKHHTAPNLCKSISIEAAELLELFQWRDKLDTQTDIAKLEAEIADITIYLFYLCNSGWIDLDAIVNEKININEINYPVTAENLPTREK